MKHITATILTLLLSLAAFAQSYTPLQMGEVFVVKNNGTDIWTITPSESGTMKIIGDNGDGEWIGSCLNVYDSPAMANQVQSYNWTFYEVQVTAGHTYFIKSFNYSGSDFRGKCVMASAFTFTGSDPADGGTFPISGDCEVRLNFSSANLTFTEGELTVNGHVIKIYNFTDYNRLVSEGIFTYTEDPDQTGHVNYNGCVLGHADNLGINIPFITNTGYEHLNVIYDLFEKGEIKSGDRMELNLHGVQNSLSGELLGGNGELAVTWYLGEAPTILVSDNVPTVLNSWYNTGDPASLITFTFSNDIKSAEATLMMGNAEANDVYSESLDVQINGKEVTLDLSGIQRTYKTMGLTYAWPSYELRLSKVKDINGNPTYAGGQGLDASYSYTLNYNDITTTLSYEITPASGTTLSPSHKEVEIWLSDKSIVEYSGVEFNYYTEEGGDIIAHSVRYNVGDKDLKIQEDGAQVTITCPIPDEVRSAPNLSVSLDITRSVDGLAHPVSAYYNTTLSHDWDISMMAEPQSGATTHRLAEVILTLNSTFAINPSKALVVGTKDGELLYYANIEPDGMTNARIVLDLPITAAGTYTLSIEDGAIGDYLYGDSRYTCGTCCKPFSLTYNVTGKWDGKDLVTDPDEGAVEHLLEIRLISFAWNSILPSWNYKPYLEYEDSGERIGADFLTDNSLQPYELAILLDRDVTTPGKCKLVIPAGAISEASTGDPIEQEYTFQYEILGYDPSAVCTPSAKIVSKHTYNLSGARTGKPTKGLYIINGKKTVIR